MSDGRVASIARHVVTPQRAPRCLRPARPLGISSTRWRPPPAGLVARAESGQAGITVDTLRRLLGAAGFDLAMAAERRPIKDPVTAVYRRDVDRTLLRENRRRSVDDRLRAGAEMVADLRDLQRSTRSARPRGGQTADELARAPARRSPRPPVRVVRGDALPWLLRVKRAAGRPKDLEALQEEIERENA